MIQTIVLHFLLFTAGVFVYFRLLSRARRHLLLRKTEDESEERVDGLIEILTQYLVTVLVGHTVYRLRPLDLLSFFWTDGPSSPCDECLGAFADTKGPPIRTLRLEGSPGEKPQLWTIRIHNRHLSCCKDREKSIMPVSHVWHPEISKAHHKKTSNFDAELSLFQTIFPLLEATTRAYSFVPGGLEIWHDYVSVPQWEFSTQQQLLLCLPTIYSMADNIVVHLQDISLENLSHMFYGKVSEFENLKSIGKFFQSQWFRRMWPILEFANCHNASILTSDYVVANKMGHGGILDNSFTFMWVMGMMKFMEKAPKYIAQKNGLDGIQVPEPDQIYIEQIRPRIRTGNTVGEVVGIIGSKQCQVHRDRFIAVCALLNMWDYRNVSQQIPEDSLKACQWVMMECLKRGDYTPLLLTPSGESEIPGWSWMRTHEQMSRSSWGLGQLVQAAKSASIIHDGEVMPELMSVGVIEEAYFLDMVDAKLESFSEIIALLCRLHGDDLEQFTAAIGRIYAGSDGKLQSEVPRSLSEATAQNPSYESQLRKLIDKFKVDAYKRQDIASQICEHMGLLKPNQYKIGTSLHIVEIYGESNAYLLGAIAVVRCNGCQQRFLFHLFVYTKDIIGSKLYRIPGLWFTTTASNGVGLAISEQKKIVGRMTTGRPACECTLLTLVEIV